MFIRLLLNKKLKSQEFKQTLNSPDSPQKYKEFKKESKMVTLNTKDKL